MSTRWDPRDAHADEAAVVREAQRIVDAARDDVRRAHAATARLWAALR